MRLELELDGDVQIKRDILRLGEHAGDASPAFRDLADYFRRLEKRQFDSQGGTGSGGWPPLAESTRRRKYGTLRGTRLRRGQFTRKALAQSQQILVETGALKDSLTQAGDEQHIEDVQPQELRFGTGVPYAKYHQHGTSKMPRRRPLELSETQRKESVRRLQRWIVTGEMGGSGKRRKAK